MGRRQHAELDRQIVADQIDRVGQVLGDSTGPPGRQYDIIRPVNIEESRHRGAIP